VTAYILYNKRAYATSACFRLPSKSGVTADMAALTLCAKTGLLQRSKIASLDYLIGEQLH
jgi:hypothetical protein